MSSSKFSEIFKTVICVGYLRMTSSAPYCLVITPLNQRSMLFMEFDYFSNLVSLFHDVFIKSFFCYLSHFSLSHEKGFLWLGLAVKSEPTHTSHSITQIPFYRHWIFVLGYFLVLSPSPD